MAEGGTVSKRCRVLNIVHNDEIWKDHVRHETTSARQKWPDTWGYLVREYKRMNRILEGRPASSRAPSRLTSGIHGQTVSTGLKLPVIPGRRQSYPRTTSQEVGWKSVQNGLNSEMVTRFAEHKRGKTTIFKKLNWPKDGI